MRRSPGDYESPLVIVLIAFTAATSAACDSARLSGKSSVHKDEVGVRQAFIAARRSENENDIQLERISDTTVGFEGLFTYIMCKSGVTHEELMAADFGHKLEATDLSSVEVELVDRNSQMTLIKDAVDEDNRSILSDLDFWEITPVVFNSDRSKALMGMIWQADVALPIVGGVQMYEKNSDQWVESVEWCGRGIH